MLQLLALLGSSSFAAVVTAPAASNASVKLVSPVMRVHAPSGAASTAMPVSPSAVATLAAPAPNFESGRKKPKSKGEETPEKKPTEPVDPPKKDAARPKYPADENPRDVNRWRFWGEPYYSPYPPELNERAAMLDKMLREAGFRKKPTSFDVMFDGGSRREPATAVELPSMDDLLWQYGARLKR